MKRIRSAIKRYLEMRLISIVCAQEGKDFLLRYYFDKGGKVRTYDVRMPMNDPVIETISDFFPSAGVYEREVHDFFGVEFFGNPRLHEKLLLPETWEGKPPMRKEHA